MLVAAAARQLGPQVVFLSYLDRTTGQYRAFPMTDSLLEGLTDAEALRDLLGFGRARPEVHASLAKYKDRPVKFWFHRNVFRINGLIRNEAFFRKRNMTWQDWKAAQPGFLRRRPGLESLAFGGLAKPGDRLVLLDSSWTVSRAEGAFLAAKDAGLVTYSMIYDLVPIVVPEFTTGDSPLSFHDWLLQTGAYTSVYLAGSRSTQRDLEKFLQCYGIERPVTAIPLAQAALPAKDPLAAKGPLVTRVDAAAYPRLREGAGIDERIRALSTQPYVLCVGTLQARKNIWRTALAWDRLRQMSGLAVPKLVFAGRAGWMTQDFENLIDATRNLYGWIEILDGPSDAELDFLYRNCSFVIMASHYEGWGLPVGEALGYGKTAVISNTSSLPEVGGDLVEYCNPMSVDSIVDACLRLIRDPEHRLALETRIKATALRGWDQVADDLVRAIKLSD